MAVRKKKPRQTKEPLFNISSPVDTRSTLREGSLSEQRDVRRDAKKVSGEKVFRHKRISRSCSIRKGLEGRKKYELSENFKPLSVLGTSQHQGEEKKKVAWKAAQKSAGD